MKFKSFFESFRENAYVMDLDDTLFTSDAKVVVYKAEGEAIELTPSQFNTYQKHPDDKMDFSQFEDPELFLRTAKPTKYLKVAQNISKAARSGSSNAKLYILTARNSSIKNAITQKLSSLGVMIDGFFSSGDTDAPTIAEGKKQILEKIRSMHKGRITFFDDDEKNIALAKQIPGIHVRMVSRESIDRLAESWDDEESGGDRDSLFMNHISGVREAVRRMGIDADSVRLINTRQNIKSAKEIIDVSGGKYQWYAIGLSWIEWMQSEMPQWLSPFTYAIEIDKPLMITPKNIAAFQKKYIVNPEQVKDKAINWKKLYTDKVGAIEFNPYDKSSVDLGSSFWYYSIDVDSGAIVNKSSVKKIVKLYDGTDDFRDMGIKI